jgi:hypothetical protein
MRAELPAQVVELVDAFRNPITQIEFLYLLANANILEPVLVDAETADRMVRPYSWFLDRVGPEGIKLTSAGYLRPVDVEAASAELDLAGEWIGKHNREVQTLPVLELRESAMHLGLLRKYRGMLLATPRGRKLRDDPLGLWWHLAEQLPPTKMARHVTHAGLLLLAATVIGSAAGDDPLEYVARMLDAAGWQNSDGTPLTKWQAYDTAADTHIVLIRLGALVQARPGLGPEQPTGDGAVFARAALRTWPALANVRVRSRRLQVGGRRVHAVLPECGGRPD